jgi:hypothetical protein
MDKNAVLGELIYVIANYEKGRVKPKGVWTKRYKKSLQQSMDILKRVTNLLIIQKKIVYLHEDIICLIKANIGTIFPSDKGLLGIWQNEKYALV